MLLYGLQSFLWVRHLIKPHSSEHMSMQHVAVYNPFANLSIVCGIQLQAQRASEQALARLAELGQLRRYVVPPRRAGIPESFQQITSELFTYYL